MMALLSSKPVPRLRIGSAGGEGNRQIPEEAAIAFTYGRSTYAVMMATPDALEDFAIGFSLSEGVVEQAADITALEIILQDTGIELRMDLVPGRDAALLARRRIMAGPAGCGLCGIEGLAAAMRRPARITKHSTLPAAEIFAAFAALRAQQPLNALTRAVHAAGYWSLAEGRLIAVREDVGRHNALDKLGGACARAGRTGDGGLLVLTSRVSIELVQKAASLGFPLVAAISVPTASAVRTAQEAGITLIAVAREDAFEVFTHPQRLA